MKKEQQSSQDLANSQAMEVYENIFSHEKKGTMTHIDEIEAPTIHLNWALLKSLALSKSPFDRMEALTRRMSASVRAAILAVSVAIFPILTMIVTIWAFGRFTSDSTLMMKLFAMAALMGTVGIVYVLLHLVFLLIFRSTQRSSVSENQYIGIEYAALASGRHIVFERYKTVVLTGTLFLILIAMGYIASYRITSHRTIGIQTSGASIIKLRKQDPLAVRLVSKDLIDDVSISDERDRLLGSYVWIIRSSDQWYDKNLIAKAPDSEILNALAVSLEAKGRYSEANNLYILGSKKNPKNLEIPFNYGKFIASQKLEIDAHSPEVLNTHEVQRD